MQPTLVDSVFLDVTRVGIFDASKVLVDELAIKEGA